MFICYRVLVNKVLCVVRLIGTERNASSGRLEVKYDGVWGTVCDEGFTDIAAKVACNGLGFGYVE